MYDINELFFELIRVAIGTQNTLTRAPSAEEWAELYAMSKKQSLVGICFAGVQRLGNASYENQNENENRLEPSETLETYWNLPEMQYLTWMGMAAKIQQRNEVVNRQCVELCNALEKEHFRSCILKGQGTASLYKVRDDSLEVRDLSALRQSGDIDIWLMPKDVRTIKESRPRIDEMVHRQFPDEKGAFVHIGYPCFQETEVEVHYVPTMDGNPWVDRRFRRLFEERQNECFASTKLSTGSNVNESGFAVPEPMVNVLFNLHHIKRHFICSGVGLRHVIDLYFVLQRLGVLAEASVCSSRASREARLEVRDMIKKLGMKKFFAGIVWVMEEVLLNDNPSTCSGQSQNENLFLKKNSNLSTLTSNLGIKPDEHLGRFILQEIIQGGNFGHYDERLKGVNDMGFWERWKHFLQVSIVRARYFPTEVLWSYVFRMRIGIWRKTGIEI